MTIDNFSFELKEDGIHIDNNGRKFRVSYEESHLNYEDAKKWAQEHGGELGSVAQLRLLAKHQPQINEELKKAGKEPLGGWVWTNEECYRSADCAYLVGMLNGNVISNNKGSSHCVRAVSAL